MEIYEQAGNIRIDTHGENQVMQKLFNKMGFVRCGIIHVPQDNYPRIAFQKYNAECNSQFSSKKQ